MRHRVITADRRTGTLLSLALVLLLAAGCASGASGAASGGQAGPSPEEAAMATDLPASPAPGVLECGARFASTPGGALSVTGRFPTAARAGEQMVAGTVAVAAKRGEARGVVTPQAEAFLVRDGRIVTLPVPQDAVGQRLDLTDGSVQSMPATVTLVPCSGDGVLPAGSYDLYVRVVLNHDDGTRADSLGGPWPLEVR
jgi:hypothetical protein